MLRFLLYILVSFCAVSAYAQDQCDLTISGTIKAGNEPLFGASIYIRELQKGAATDANGFFKLNGVCAGNYHVEVKYLGFSDSVFVLDLAQPKELAITLRPTQEVLKEVRVEEKFEQVNETSNFSALAGRALDETKGKSLGEALKELPGVSSIQAGPSIFKPVIHGVHSQRILMLNNGIRQEGQQWGAEHAPEIDPFIAANIVVIKDATAIKYGTDALGGVIVVNPPDLPVDATTGGEINIVGQSNGRSGTISGTLEGGIKSKPGWGWRIQGTAKKSGDFHAPDYNLSNTGFNELNFSAAAGFHKGKTGVEIFFSHFQTSLGILLGSSISNPTDLETAYDREPPQHTTAFTYDIQSPRQQVSHDLFKLNAHRHGALGDWRLQYGFQMNDRQEFDLRRSSLSDIPSINLQLFTHTLDFELEHTLSKEIQGSVGVNGMLQVNNNIAGTQRIPFIPDYNNSSAGVFWVEKITAGKWLIDLGARYDFRHYNIVGFDYKNSLYRSRLDFHNVSGTAGVSRALGKHSKVTTTLGSTWRPPNVAELYSQGMHQSAGAMEYGLLLNGSTNEIMDLDSVNFKNEQALKWVTSYRFTSERWDFEVTGYINYIFNYIYLKPRGVTENVRGYSTYLRYTQTDASFAGLDFSASYAMTSQWQITGQVSLLRATDEKQNDYLVFIPSNRYDIGLRYTHPMDGNVSSFFVESKIKYTAKQTRAPRVVSVREINAAAEQGIDLFENDSRNFDFVAAPGAYMVMNVSAGVSVKVGESRVDVRAGASNLFNTSYREYTNRFRYFADDIGQNFSLALKYAF